MIGVKNTELNKKHERTMCESFYTIAEQVCKIIKGLLQRITNSKQLSPIAIGVAYLLRISIYHNFQQFSLFLL